MDDGMEPWDCNSDRTLAQSLSSQGAGALPGRISARDGMKDRSDSAAFLFDEAAIQEYLAFGFNPSEYNQSLLAILSEWSRQPRPDLLNMSEADLVHEGRLALKAAIESCAARTSGKGDQVVFLSGGLDSRTILGALLDHFTTSEIVAATFGLPGEWDFDFATTVARAAGVRHERLESFSVDWSTQGLVDSVLARRIPLPYPFGQRYLSFRLHERIGSENVFWDGLCGDSVSWQPARYFPRKGEVWSWEESLNRFILFHLLSGWKSLVKPDFDPRSYMPSAPLCDEKLLLASDQLEFGVRQQCYTITRRLSQYAIVTPFLSQPWLDFMFGIPLAYRRDQRLYLQIQRAAFPKLFALPLTTYHGGNLMQSWISHRVRELRSRAIGKAARLGVPYLNMAQDGANATVRQQYREPGPIHDLVRQNLSDLDKRGIVDWIDVNRFLDRRAGDQDMTMAVVTRLLGLEINLKASEQSR